MKESVVSMRQSFSSNHNLGVWLSNKRDIVGKPLSYSSLAPLKSYFSMDCLINPFPDAFRRLFSRRFFENIVTREEIAQDEQFLLLPQYFQLYSILKLSFIEIVQYFCPDEFKVVCCRFVVCWKGVLISQIPV